MCRIKKFKMNARVNLSRASHSIILYTHNQRIKRIILLFRKLDIYTQRIEKKRNITLNIDEIRSNPEERSV